MNVSDSVERILREWPETRDSDNKLIVAFFQLRGANFTRKQMDLLESVSFESIRRSRQKIQEEGRYPATERVKKARKFKAMRVQQIAPKASPNYLQQTINDTKAMRWMED